jgi:hypothetical protein
MEKINNFQQAITETLAEYKAHYRQTSQNLRHETLADDKNHHYQFLWTGWKGDNHIFKVVFHIDILDNKIWIQQDSTEVGIANILVEKGISKQDIVLGYFTAAHRRLTDFAVA